MKKTFLATVIFSVTLLSTPILSFSEQRLSVQKDKINVRSGPGTNHEILWKAEKYYPLQVLDTNDKWIHFRDFEGYDGWVYKPLLSNDKTIVTKNRKSNIRKGPGKEYPVLFTAGKGVPFLVLETKKDWYKVRHSDGDTGWVFKSLIW
ncbi:SH3 domain-containing protein [Desulforegula conservatrix]|uniref:SH3 domain-containing protein n=1 Tax=Desulforegula conservatrix TaxID=153026 RepID=UPI000414151E|nr:SH3 domain-containing protein [Desulforegula conservatrix]